MTIKDLIIELGNYPYDMQVFVASDEEGNSIQKILSVEQGEFAKTNNDGSYDGVIIFPSGEEVREYDPEEDGQ